MNRASAGLFALAAAIAAPVFAPGIASADSSAFLKFESGVALERFLAANAGVERLHPALPWAFGSRSVLLAASARETAGVIVGSFTENRAFQIPPSEPSVELPGPVREAFGIDSRFWGVSRMKAPKAWAVTLGEGVIVAVVDTGVDSSHPTLAYNIALNEAKKMAAPVLMKMVTVTLTMLPDGTSFLRTQTPTTMKVTAATLQEQLRATLILKTFFASHQVPRSLS